MNDPPATDLFVDKHRNTFVFNLLREFQLFDGCLMGLAHCPSKKVQTAQTPAGIIRIVRL